jgi:hypothetical protein
VAIYTELTERARYLAANSSSLKTAAAASSLGESYQKCTSLNELLFLDGVPVTTPYCIVSYPLSVFSRSISTGPNMENVRGGSVEVLLVQYIGKPLEGNPPDEAEFMTLAGNLFEEMDNARDTIISPAETTAGSYLWFDEFTTERDMERSPFADREDLTDYMHVGWRLSSNPGATQ